MREAAAIHGLAWLAWLGAIVVVTSTTRNPWYLGVTLLWVAVTEAAAKRQPLLGRSAPIWSLLRFGLLVIPVAALFNALTVHVGATVLGRLPASWPLLGGAITLEAMLYGALNGLALTILFGAFAVVNRMLPLRAIIHLIPRTYYPVAIVAAIAITFVPVTLQQWQQIGEAQAVRGHKLRGTRSWLALWLPLLTSGMERALQLAEAMTARGFAGGAVSHSPAQQMALVGGLAAVMSGLLLRTIWGQPVVGVPSFFLFAVVTLVISSVGLFGLILFTTKRRTKEIGIRKVLGSSIGAIYQQLSLEVIGLLGFAVVVASPMAWLIYKKLPGAYKAPLTVSEFLLAIALIAAVAFITISYHVLKVAFSNPVDALKYE